MAMRYVEAGSADELSSGQMKAIVVEEQTLLLANVGGMYYAIQRKCPHMGADLSKGTLDGNVVTCRMHGAAFDLTNGEPVKKAKLLIFKMQPKKATTFPVKIEGGRVLIGL